MVVGEITDTEYYIRLVEFFNEYREFAPIIAIGLPFLESFMPFLPLFAFVFANAAIFGFWLGFLYSWLGACLGSIIVFTLVRKYGQKRFFAFLNKHEKVKQTIIWMEEKGFAPIFLLYCFPFTPSGLINVVAGLSRAKPLQFVLALTLGKVVMISSVSYIGYDIASFIAHPIKALIVLIGIAFVWLLGKLLEKKLGLGVVEKQLESR